MKKIYIALSVLTLILAQCSAGFCQTSTVDSLFNRIAEDQQTFKMAQPSAVTSPTTENTSVSNSVSVDETQKPVVKKKARVRRPRRYRPVTAKPVVTVNEVVGKNASPAPQPAVTPPTTAASVKSPATPDRKDRISEFAEEAKKSKTANTAGGTAKTIFRTIFSLALVCGLAYVCMLLLKRLQGKTDITPRSTKHLKIVDTVKLTPSSGLYLINMNGKTLLVGCSSEQVNLLREFEAEEIPEGEGPGDGRFAEYLEKYSEETNSDNATGRVAGLLRDCTTYLKGRQYNAVAASKARKGKTNDEA